MVSSRNGAQTPSPHLGGQGTESPVNAKEYASGNAHAGGNSAALAPAPIPIANANSNSTMIGTNPSSSSATSSSVSSTATQNAPVSTSLGGRKEKKRGQVYMEDLPGTRVDPDDGPWPKAHDILESEEDVWREMRSLARPHRGMFVNYEKAESNSRWEYDLDEEEQKAAGGGNGGNGSEGFKMEEKEEHPRITIIDSINFQPCRTLKTQDRYVVTQLDIHGEMWTLTGVFDGHLGDVTVEHVAHHLPIIIRDFLRANLPSPSSVPNPSSPNDVPTFRYNPEQISHLFRSAIAAFDDAIAHDVLDLFGGSVDQLEKYTDEEIRSVINDNHHAQGMYGSPPKFNHTQGASGAKEGENWRKARLCMYGTTALVTLIDPTGEGLWVANLGDCMGILVTRTVAVGDESDEKDGDSNGEWNVEILTTMQNGDNDEEIERVKREHPGEEDTCIVDRRVLGALAPTRCLGDIPFKQPPEFTRRILYNLYPFVHNTAPWEDFLQRNKTPPYISAQAEVVYRGLRGAHADGGSGEGSGNGKKKSRISAVLGLEKLGVAIKRIDKKRSKSQSPIRRRTKKQRYLILASDGFTDLCSTGGGVEAVVKSWARELVQIGSPRKEVEELREKIRAREREGQIGGDAIGDGGPCLVVETSAPADIDPLGVPRPMSPVSPTSPVPFTAGSYSSMGSMGSMGSLAIPVVDSSNSNPAPVSAPEAPLALPAPAIPVPKLQRPPVPHTNKSYHCTSPSNMALRLLRRVLGGEERSNTRVAKALTVDMNVSWVDDTAIVVVGL